MKTTHERLDTLLVERGFAASRLKAAAMILAGSVLVNDVPVEKAGYKVAKDVDIRIRGDISPFVGRGGEKLSAALQHFRINVEECVVVDVGASTGGFTDCLLQRGAKKVFAVDVGYNQLDYSLRKNPQVVVMERTNAKDLKLSCFSPHPEFAVIDLSFIGLRKILIPVIGVLKKPFRIVALVKPQFELGPEYVESGGVVRKEKDQRLAVNLVEEHARQLGLDVVGSFPSPLKGRKKGNQEFFVFLNSGQETSSA